MRIILIISWTAAAAVVFAGCGGASSPAEDRIDVVTAFYPLEEAVGRIAGDHVSVTDLTPPGVEPHDLELTADDLEAIGSADLVLFFGGGFQPAVEDAVQAAATGVTVDVLDELATSSAYELLSEPDGEVTVDPHVWLDPAGQAAIAEVVRDALGRVATTTGETFSRGFDPYAAELDTLAERFGVLETCSQDLLVTGHEAFGYLARAYGLEQVGVAGLSPEAEPGPARLADIAELVATEAVSTIYAEDLLPPDVVETIATQTGARVDVLTTIESLTDGQREAGEDYGSLMEANLATLTRGQDCG